MSWFALKDQKERKYRKGVWLRIRALPDELLAQIKPCLGKSDMLAWVEIKELREKNKVLLEVWCHQMKFMSKVPQRFTVFHVETDENPNWICEGDMGRGFVQKGRRRKR